MAHLTFKVFIDNFKFGKEYVLDIKIMFQMSLNLWKKYKSYGVLTQYMLPWLQVSQDWSICIKMLQLVSLIEFTTACSCSSSNTAHSHHCAT